jgi:hypothetical protein
VQAHLFACTGMPSAGFARSLLSSASLCISSVLACTHTHTHTHACMHAGMDALYTANRAVNLFHSNDPDSWAAARQVTQGYLQSEALFGAEGTEGAGGQGIKKALKEET